MEQDFALHAGSVLDSGKFKYTIVKVLGNGTFGITYLATIPVRGSLGSLEMKVAVKEFFMKDVCSRRADGSLQEMTQGGLVYNYAIKFRREAENLSRLDHPQIVRVLDVFTANNTVYYAMEFVEGESLNEYLKEHGRMSESEAVSCIRSIAAPLEYMHEHKMLHLDLKPGNVMRRSSDGKCVLIDFGLSKYYADNGEPESSTNIGMGTPGYAPIEQAQAGKNRQVYPTLDIYALGGTFYKLLTGEAPPEASELLDGFPREKLLYLGSGISVPVADAIEKAMSPRRIDRPQSVLDFLMLLEEPDPSVTASVAESEDTDFSEQSARGGKNSGKIPYEAAKRTTGTINGHEWVDLGLSVKWATCNVGAFSPSDYGNYYAWGETRTKSEYTKDNCSTNGVNLGDISGDVRYDAARANWGGTWRLPTQAEMQELIDKCTWTRTKQGGHYGYRVTGPNGKSIFLPAAGFRGGSSLDYAGDDGYYWSSAPYKDDTSAAFSLNFSYSSDHTLPLDWHFRLNGQCVRPVSGDGMGKASAGTIGGQRKGDFNRKGGHGGSTGNFGKDWNGNGRSGNGGDARGRDDKGVGEGGPSSSSNPSRAKVKAILIAACVIVGLVAGFFLLRNLMSGGGHGGSVVTGDSTLVTYTPCDTAADGADVYTRISRGEKVPVRANSSKDRASSGTVSREQDNEVQTALDSKDEQIAALQQQIKEEREQRTRDSLAAVQRLKERRQHIKDSVAAAKRAEQEAAAKEEAARKAAEEKARQEAARKAAEEARSTTGTINGHQWVDLGLSVKWATCNVGASSPSDYGNYYAWGETRTKSEYTEDNSSTYGINIGDISGDNRYDAARANWGGTWRLPTEAEMEELMDKCTWTWTSQGGHNGYRVTGPNGSSIFLPAAGYRGGSSLYNANVTGHYHNSTPDMSDATIVYHLFIDNSRSVWFADSDSRSSGQSVRPVSD